MPAGEAGYLDPVSESADSDADLGRRPDGVNDATVEATGSVSEALEFVERARGHLYSFHQLMGHADLLLGEACDKLRAAGHDDIADRLEGELVGRNVLYGRWTFQVVEEFDDSYWSRLPRPRTARPRGTAAGGAARLRGRDEGEAAQQWPIGARGPPVDSRRGYRDQGERRRPPTVPLSDIDLGSWEFWGLDDDVRDGAFATLRREAPVSFHESSVGEEFTPVPATGR